MRFDAPGNLKNAFIRGIVPFGKINMNQNITLVQNLSKSQPAKFTIKIKYWWLALAGLLLRILPYLFTEPSSMADLKRICLCLSYVLLLFVLVRNLRIKGLWIILTGTLLNFIGMMANGGFMPVAPDARLLADKAPVIMQAGSLSLTNAGGVILLPGQTRLMFLTDILPVSSLHSVFSIGDIIICLGILIVCIRLILQALIRTPASVPELHLD